MLEVLSYVVVGGVVYAAYEWLHKKLHDRHDVWRDGVRWLCILGVLFWPVLFYSLVFWLLVECVRFTDCPVCHRLVALQRDQATRSCAYCGAIVQNKKKLAAELHREELRKRAAAYNEALKEEAAK